MKFNKNTLFLLIFFLGLPSATFADTEQALRSLVEENLIMSQQENIAGVMATVHTQSPIYRSQMNIMEAISPAYDLEYQLLDFRFIAKDETYAYARIKFSTKKISGGNFQDNDLEALSIFRKENGRWKFWNQSNLELNFK